MNKKLSTFIVGAFALAFSTPGANAQSQLFTTGANCYRIPSIVRLLDGTLWAFSDLRHGSNGDVGASSNQDGKMRIDIAGRKGKFSNNAYTWDTENVLLEGKKNATEDYLYAFSDAASVVDRETGKVLIMTANGKESVNSSLVGYPLVARSVFSDNKWTTSNVSSWIYGENNLYGGHMFVSSGRMIQSTIYKKKDYYRIYAGVCTVGSMGSRVIYSDDFGETWHYLGGYKATPVIIGNECKVEELPDGSILLNTRTNAAPWWGRHFNIFKFTDIANGKGTWQYNYVTSGASNIADQTYAPDCNAEMLLVPAKRVEDNVQTYLLLISAPTAAGRSKVSIYWKELPANYSNLDNYISGWTKYSSNNANNNGYSTMTLDENGNIAFLSEIKPWQGSIQFKSLAISDVTSGAYTYSPSAAGTYHTTSEPNFEHGVGGVVMPTLSVNGGVYTETKTVSINVPEGSKVYYTLDGSEPVIPTTAPSTEVKAVNRASTTNTTKEYKQPIELSEGSTTLNAVAVDANNNRSKTLTASYLITSANNNTSTTPTTTSKTGITVSLDNTSCMPLYSDGASGSDAATQPFAYFRHKEAHLQLITSNNSTLAAGTRHFAAINNNLLLTNDKNKYLTISNGTYYDHGAHHPRLGYFAVVAPKGVRFLRFQIELDPSSGDMALTRYKYDADNNVVLLDSVEPSTSQTVTFDRTFENGTNALYFRVNSKAQDTQRALVIKSFKVTYAIDESFEVQIPNADTAKIHTGFIDLQKLSWNHKSSANDRKGYFSFPNSNLNDKQQIKVVNADGTTVQNGTSGGDSYFVAATQGDYYVEAPTKFRIVGATFNIKRAEAKVDQTYTPSSASSNVPIFFRANDKSDNFLKIDDSGNAVNVTNRDEATVFTLNYNEASDENHYSLQLNNGKYLVITDKITTTADKVLWSCDGNGLKYNTSAGYRYIGNNANNNGYLWDPRQMGKFCPTIKTVYTYPAGDFMARVFNRENNGPAVDDCQMQEKHATQTVTLKDLNNDAVHINFYNIASGSAALFSVSLQLCALNPEVASVEAAAIVNDGTKDVVVGNSSVNSYNYVFNAGNTINVPIPSKYASDKNANIKMVFCNAKNEEQTLWYTTGTNNNNPQVKSGYSNVYLVGSASDDPTKGFIISDSDFPSARANTDKAGTVPINTTNIEDVSAEKADKLKDNTVDQASANYSTVTMSLANPSVSGNNKFYFYSKDEPTYQIMPEGISPVKHSDFRFYTISVKPVVAETPKVEVVNIYSSTMKGAPHKTSSTLESDKNELNTSQKYVGLKVTSQLNEGTNSSTPLTKSLNAEDIFTAINTALNDDKYGFSEGQRLRGVLYVDMSELSSVSVNSDMSSYMDQTADNCLFFMPQGFAGTNMPNVISKQSDGSYQAFGDVTVYDQQPFFSPYAFTTGTYMVKYEREGTVAGANVKAKVRNMAAVLPFSIALDGQGHPYLDGTDNSTSNITFYSVTGSGELTGVKKDHTDIELTYGISMEKVTTKMAEANKPYYVTIDKDQNPGFTFNIPGATFAKTGNVDVTAGADGKKQAEIVTLKDAHKNPKKTDETWTAYGNYWGEKKNAQDDDRKAAGTSLWYFSKDLFWRAENLTGYTDVNIRPFRAYYITNATTTASKAMAVFDDSEIVTTGIEDVNAAAKNNGKVYDLNGRYVGDSLENLAPGLYIQNGRKVVRQ